MFESIIKEIKGNEDRWKDFQDNLSEMEIPPKTVLLNEGEISKHLYIIKKGCLRQSFNKEGKDITFQFFFEGQLLSSIDSFLYAQPSIFAIESIEHCELLSISKNEFDSFLKEHSAFKDTIIDILISRFRHYMLLFLSRIKDSPQERYKDIIINHPEIIKRVPQHYIASYLGITPISLSRIRNRKPK